jgi:hypothetical protein
MQLGWLGKSGVYWNDSLGTQVADTPVGPPPRGYAFRKYLQPDGSYAHELVDAATAARNARSDEVCNEQRRGRFAAAANRQFQEWERSPHRDCNPRYVAEKLRRMAANQGVTRFVQVVRGCQSDPQGRRVSVVRDSPEYQRLIREGYAVRP